MSDLFDLMDDGKKNKKKMMPIDAYERPPPSQNWQQNNNTNTNTNQLSSQSKPFEFKKTAEAFVPSTNSRTLAEVANDCEGTSVVCAAVVDDDVDDNNNDEGEDEEKRHALTAKVAKSLSIGGTASDFTSTDQQQQIIANSNNEQKLKEEQERKQEKEEMKQKQEEQKRAREQERKQEAEREEKLLMEELEKNGSGDEREHLNLVFIGHVDAGKSTIGGQILYLSGQVDQRVIEKYEKEAKDKNRDSWYMAYIMDTSEEERAKGKTVEVGKAHFATDKKRYTVLDAPGHKNYVPNMIAGAAQADVGVLVIAARKGEFETGFEKGGQTREHAQLAKTLGVTKLVVVVNKMDDPSVMWDKKRFDEVYTKLIPFLKACGYKEKDITFVPISGLKGTNLKDVVSKEECAWYTGKSFFATLDDLEPMDRDPNAPFRMPVMDKYSEMGCMIMGKTESGACRVGQKLTLMPGKIDCKIEKLWRDEDECNVCKAGENVRMKITGVDEKDIHAGMLLSHPLKLPYVTQEIECQLAIVELLDHKSIFSTGYNCIIHIHSVTEEIEVKKLISEMDPKTRQPKLTKCKYLKSGSIGVVRISIATPICVEKFSDIPQLGRFTLRDEGKTIAIGKVLRIKPKSDEIDNMSRGD
jgi:peptide chain release factor subunit 3